MRSSGCGVWLSALCFNCCPYDLAAHRLTVAGAHAAFLERCSVFEAVKVDAIARALTHRDWQIAAATNLYEYAKYAAHAVCEVRHR